ncbi:MAG: haloacid dehalogenase type II [Candidatus Nanopelagicales bacterium]
MKITDFEALSFDCYGTLIDWEAGIGAVLREWAHRRGLDMTTEELLVAYADNEAEAERNHPTDPYPSILSRAMRGLGRHLNVEVSDGDAHALAVSVPDWPAFPDSAEALERLAKRFKLIILSNIDNAGFAASNERLDVTFDAILTAENIGSYKPSPANFDALDHHVDTMGIPRDKLLHVAQSLFHDHVPAKGRGMTTVWINRRHNDPGWGATPDPAADVTPDWAFTSMAEFADAVESGRV